MFNNIIKANHVGNSANEQDVIDGLQELFCVILPMVVLGQILEVRVGLLVVLELGDDLYPEL